MLVIRLFISCNVIVTADCYLLQIQQYNLPAASAANKKAAVNGTQPEATTVAPATGQQQAADEPPRWYDVDVVKATVCTVTGYQIPTGEKVCCTLFGIIYLHVLHRVILELLKLVNKSCCREELTSLEWRRSTNVATGHSVR